MSSRAERGRVDPSTLGLIVLLLATSALRFMVWPTRPLWLDEAWTGMIVSQPTLADFARQCLYDINAPLYYGIAGLWSQLSGVSDIALRAPAMLFGLLAPLIALGPARLMSRQARYTWCALAACWAPGIWFSLEARCYTLTFMLGMANAVAFAALLRAPGHGAAWRWSVVSALLILSHYYGAVVCGFQGLTYLALCRGRALRTWPAALAFLLPFAAIGAHAVRLLHFTHPGSAWIPLLVRGDLATIAGFLFGTPLVILFIPAWLLGAFTARLIGGAQPRVIAQSFLEFEPDTRQAWIAAACSLAAALLSIAAGFFKPVFIDRYLTAFAPGVLLGLALLAERYSKDWRIAPAALAAGVFGLTLAWSAYTPLSENAFSFETASAALMRRHPQRLVFLWDNPSTPDDGSMREVAGFFFWRAGAPVSVDVVHLTPGQDPNAALLARAQAPDTAILWIYDQWIVGTAAIHHPPAIARMDDRWRCANYGRYRFGVIACSRKS